MRRSSPYERDPPAWGSASVNRRVGFEDSRKRIDSRYEEDRLPENSSLFPSDRERGSSDENYGLMSDPSNDDASRSFFRTNLDKLKSPKYRIWILGAVSVIIVYSVLNKKKANGPVTPPNPEDLKRPDFCYEHPYISSSYYTSTKSIKTLRDTDRVQVIPKKNKVVKPNEKNLNRETSTRLAIVRPFCEFDAAALPTTFSCWESLPPCRVAAHDLGDDEDFDFIDPDADEDKYFDQVGSKMLTDAKADLFLFYSQTFSENEVAIKAVDTIIDAYNEPGGWSECIDNIYAIEANIPQELDLYIPSAQEELYNWVNGPNRQFEAAFRIIQSGEWGTYDGFYLMEGDSIPIKSYWLDVVLSEIEANRPFAIMGAKYNGDKWDNFYEQIPISLLDHTNGNAIYNTSHPLMERLVGQLEVEAPCPYNSIPYDYRMSQMWIEGTMGLVPILAPKIMLNEEGENITLSNNTAMFTKWGDMFKDQHPFKETPVIHNYAATNLIPRHLGPEYIIHGAKLYSPWDPVRTKVTLVVSEWFFDRSTHLLMHLDEKDHPFSEVIIMLPPNVEAHDDYSNMTVVPTRSQHRGAPDYMDLCEAEVTTEWFMFTNSYHHVANHVDLMFTPGKYQPVTPFTPATYPFCFKFPYCKETVTSAQMFNPGHDKVVLDFDMLYHTATRNKFCAEWRERFGEEGEDLYKHKRVLRRKKVIGPSGPTGTSYAAYLFREKKDKMYKFTDRSLYGARAPFIKIFAKEEKLDGMSEEELAKRVSGMGGENTTDCNCFAFESQETCEGSPLGCIWRPLFESCRPPEMIDGGTPICPQTESPTFSPTISIDETVEETAAPSQSPKTGSTTTERHLWYQNLFKSSEHENALKPSIVAEDDDAVSRKLSVVGDNDEYPFDEPVRKPGSSNVHLENDNQDNQIQENEPRLMSENSYAPSGHDENFDVKPLDHFKDDLNKYNGELPLQSNNQEHVIQLDNSISRNNNSSGEETNSLFSMEMNSISLVSKDNHV